VDHTESPLVALPSPGFWPTLWPRGCFGCGTGWPRWQEDAAS